MNYRKRLTRFFIFLTIPAIALSVLGAVSQIAFADKAGQEPGTPAAQSPDAETHARAVLAELAVRRFDDVIAQFDSRMKAALTSDKLAQGWDTVATMAGGAFKSAGKAEIKEVQGNHVVKIECDFGKSTVPATITIDQEGHIAGLFLGQPRAKAPWTAAGYAHPSAFEEQAMTVGQDPLKLNGTLTTPKGAGRWPAVVLVQGSGSTDEDESIGPNKPFKDLAWGLANNGVAVLRYNKRTFQYPQSFKGRFTVEQESIEDARAAVSLLTARVDIDPHHIFVAGHSLGAMLAPRIAKEDPRVAGIVIMAGNTRPLADLIVEQVKYQVSLTGASSPEGNAEIEKAEKSAAAMRNPNLAAAETVDMLGVPIPGSYVLDLRAYDPAATAASLKIPILVLQAQRDCQVRMADYDGWRRALSGQSRAQFHLYPNLYHLLIPVPASDTTPLSTPADYMQPGHVAPDVVADIAGWVKEQSANSRRLQ